MDQFPTNHNISKETRILTEEILERGKEYFPELLNIEDVSTKVLTTYNGKTTL